MLREKNCLSFVSLLKFLLISPLFVSSFLSNQYLICVSHKLRLLNSNVNFLAFTNGSWFWWWSSLASNLFHFYSLLHNRKQLSRIQLRGNYPIESMVRLRNMSLPCLQRTGEKAKLLTLHNINSPDSLYDLIYNFKNH